MLRVSCIRSSCWQLRRSCRLPMVNDDVLTGFTCIYGSLPCQVRASLFPRKAQRSQQGRTLVRPLTAARFHRFLNKPFSRKPPICQQGRTLVRPLRAASQTLPPCPERSRMGRSGGAAGATKLPSVATPQISLISGVYRPQRASTSGTFITTNGLPKAIREGFSHGLTSSFQCARLPHSSAFRVEALEA